VRSLIARLILGTALLFLAGCATQRVAEREPLVVLTTIWNERLAELQTRGEFAVAGRIAVAAGEQGFSGSMRFAQGRADSTLELDGPLGVGGLRLTWNGTELAMLTSRGEALDGEAARGEIERRLGFELPLNRLRYWLLGVPAPEVQIEAATVTGERLAALAQDGWRITYAQYSNESGLPQRVTAERDVARVRIILDRWLQ
jgi:outer membrane lipoprotein LolB